MLIIPVILGTCFGRLMGCGLVVLPFMEEYNIRLKTGHPIAAMNSVMIVFFSMVIGACCLCFGSHTELANNIDQDFGSGSTTMNHYLVSLLMVPTTTTTTHLYDYPHAVQPPIG